MNLRPPAPTPEYILQNHPLEVQAIAQRLRGIIQRAVPDAAEKAYLGWHGIGYRHPQAGYFCCIFPLEDRVRLALEHGASLPDPNGLLMRPPTSSKQVRYLELYSTDDIREDVIVTLLRAAIKLRSQRDKEVK
jgi:hypothetical protein